MINYQELNVSPDPFPFLSHHVLAARWQRGPEGQAQQYHRLTSSVTEQHKAILTTGKKGFEHCKPGAGSCSEQGFPFPALQDPRSARCPSPPQRGSARRPPRGPSLRQASPTRKQPCRAHGRPPSPGEGAPEAVRPLPPPCSTCAGTSSLRPPPARHCRARPAPPWLRLGASRRMRGLSCAPPPPAGRERQRSRTRLPAPGAEGAEGIRDRRGFGTSGASEPAGLRVRIPARDAFRAQSRCPPNLPPHGAALPAR